jgi:hypothetical protein
MTIDDPQRYTTPGPLADPGPHRDALLALPKAVPELVEAVQGLLIHQDLTGCYGVERTEAHFTAANLRPVARVLDLLLADGRALTESREPGDRAGSTCRDFTLLTVAAMKAHGIPARARCGFGSYFGTGANEDHWVVEYLDADSGRWRLVDAQIDDRQRELFRIDFDTLDVPRDRFIVAGDAWRRCRNGSDAPNRYGLTAVHEFGEFWIAGNLIRDVAALSDMEMLPWDDWGAMPAPDNPIAEDLVDLFDELAALTADPDTAAGVRERYVADGRLRVPETVHNFARQKHETVMA